MPKHDDPYNDGAACLAYFFAFFISYVLFLSLGLWMAQ